MKYVECRNNMRVKICEECGEQKQKTLSNEKIEEDRRLKIKERWEKKEMEEVM